jgi:hypothetical protein
MHPSTTKNPALDMSPPYKDDDVVPVDTVPRGWSAWFGGPNTTIGRRIAPRIAPVAGATSDDESDSGMSSDAILQKQLAEEAGSAIQYRTCSWQKTTALLFSEYICLVCRGIHLRLRNARMISNMTAT